MDRQLAHYYAMYIGLLRKKNREKLNIDTNNSIPYGLCKKFGYSFPDDAEPEDVWNILKEKTGKDPNYYYKQFYDKGGSKQKIHHFRTKGTELMVTYDMQFFKKGNGKKKKNGIILKGEKITDVHSFAGQGSGKNLVKSGILSKQYNVNDKNGWSHKEGLANIISSNGQVMAKEIHWFEHPEIGQVSFKIKT